MACLLHSGADGADAGVFHCSGSNPTLLRSQERNAVERGVRTAGTNAHAPGTHHRIIYTFPKSAIVGDVPTDSIRHHWNRSVPVADGERYSVGKRRAGGVVRNG